MEMCTPKEFLNSEALHSPLEFITIYFKHDRGKSENMYEDLLMDTATT